MRFGTSYTFSKWNMYIIIHCENLLEERERTQYNLYLILKQVCNNSKAHIDNLIQPTRHFSRNTSVSEISSTTPPICLYMYFYFYVYYLVIFIYILKANI